MLKLPFNLGTQRLPSAVPKAGVTVHGLGSQDLLPGRYKRPNQSEGGAGETNHIGTAIASHQETNGTLNMKLPILTALLLTASCATPQAEPDPDPVQLRSAISTALLGGDTANAEVAANEAESALPADAIIALLAAEAHVAAGADSAALISLNRAIKLAPTDDLLQHALRNRGTLFMQTGRSSEAFADLSRVYDLGNESVALLRDLGAAAYGAGDFQAARLAWEQLPDSDRHDVDSVVGPGFFLTPVSVNR
jgi:tetratricopeptide (TPR) repeat protein